MINCKKYADDILSSVKGYGHLAVISIGSDPASESYIKGKKADCERVGFKFTHHHFEEGVSTFVVAGLIDRLNRNDSVTGIIVQLPLPEGYDADKITNFIAPEKDVDGFSSDSPYKPCTPEGILYLLRQELGRLEGKHAVVVGRGKLVGKPLAKMLMEENMTVTVCHSKTPSHLLHDLSMIADAIIVAAGKPLFFEFEDCNRDCVVVDCGVHRRHGKLYGDVYGACTEHITPVPGGVGLLTRAMLIKHTERGEVR